MKEQVREINDMLRRSGAAAIQENNIPGRGHVVGYRPQYVLDAVNAVLGQDRWRWDIIATNVYETKNGGASVTVQIALYIRSVDGSWWKKGEHFGGSTVTMGSYGDAFKAATTDAIQKAFSTLSIARDAYSGLLASGQRPAPHMAPPAPPNPAEGRTAPSTPPNPPATTAANAPGHGSNDTVHPSSLGLPDMEQMQFVRQGRRIVAVPLVSGAAFSLKGLLKQAGFRFDPQMKAWWTEAANAA